MVRLLGATPRCPTGVWSVTATCRVAGRSPNVIAPLPRPRIVRRMNSVHSEVEFALSQAHSAARVRLRRGEPCRLIVLFHIAAGRAEPIIVCPRANSEADLAALADSASGIARGYGAHAVTLGVIGRLVSATDVPTPPLHVRPTVQAAVRCGTPLLLLRHERPGATTRSAYAMRPDGPSAERVELDRFSGPGARLVVGDDDTFTIPLASFEAIRFYGDAPQRPSVAQL